MSLVCSRSPHGLFTVSGGLRGCCCVGGEGTYDQRGWAPFGVCDSEGYHIGPLIALVMRGAIFLDRLLKGVSSSVKTPGHVPGYGTDYAHVSAVRFPW